MSPVSESESGSSGSGSERYLISDLTAGTFQKLRINKNFILFLRHPSLDHARLIHTVRQRNQLHNLLALADVMQHFHRFSAVDRFHAIRLRDIRQIIVCQPQRSKDFQIHIIYFIIIPVRRNLHISFRRTNAREKRRAKKHDEKD